jgi:hypothetical protein
MLNGIDLLGNDLDLNRSTTAPTLRIKIAADRRGMIQKIIIPL